MAKPFRKIRALTDQQLNGALSNHQYVLQGVLAWVQQRNRWQWVWRVWAVFVTVGVVLSGAYDQVVRLAVAWLLGVL